MTDQTKREKWIEACAKRYIEKAGLDIEDAHYSANVCAYMQADAEGDDPTEWEAPEDAADEDMTYWEAE